MIQGPPDLPLPLQLTLGPAYTGKGVRAYIEKLDKTLVGTVDLDHSRLGTYTGWFSYPTEEFLVITFVVYTAPDFVTIDTTIERTAEIYRIKHDAPSLNDMLDSGLAKTRYENRMTTVFSTDSGEHEVVAWADKDGQRVTSATDCEIVVKNSSGTVMYTDTLVTPNSDGVFRFNRPFSPSADKNFYVIIAIKVDDVVRISHQSFFTLG